jgi:CheY-like chemotaxis protein
MVHEGEIRSRTLHGQQVVLCDLGLPGMDGVEVARGLQNLDSGASTLLVALTGYGQEEDRRQTSEAGFQVHLTKPVDGEVLKQLLASPSLAASL